MSLRFVHTTNGKICTVGWVHGATGHPVEVRTVAVLTFECPECLLAEARRALVWAYENATGLLSEAPPDWVMHAVMSANAALKTEADKKERGGLQG
jgi:hypothetical protein